MKTKAIRNSTSIPPPSPKRLFSVSFFSGLSPSPSCVVVRPVAYTKVPNGYNVCLYRLTNVSVSQCPSAARQASPLSWYSSPTRDRGLRRGDPPDIVCTHCSAPWSRNYGKQTSTASALPAHSGGSWTRKIALLVGHGHTRGECSRVQSPPTRVPSLDLLGRRWMHDLSAGVE